MVDAETAMVADQSNTDEICTGRRFAAPSLAGEEVRRNVGPDQFIRYGYLRLLMPGAVRRIPTVARKGIGPNRAWAM